MDSYQVTDEGGGIIRIDAQSRLVRKAMASAMCDDVDALVADKGEFKILMNMSAMSKGTPAAGFYVLRSMKQYPLRALALFGANAFMQGMARTVLGLARFSNFDIFGDEVSARGWLERAGAEPTADGAGPEATPGRGPLGRLAAPAALLASGVLMLRRRRRRRRRQAAETGSPMAGLAR